MQTFENTIWIDGIKDYFTKAKMMEDKVFNNASISQEQVNDNLVWFVPIYDVVHRKYAAFNTLLTALWYQDKDPKNNGNKYIGLKLDLLEWIYIFYTFRVTGSGINYNPKNHGFGNCIHQHMLPANNTLEKMIQYIQNHEGLYADTKGYQLPTISYKHLTSGHLKHYMATDAADMCKELAVYLEQGSIKTIVQVTDFITNWHKERGFKKYNFVSSATAMDIAEFFPDLVDKKSEIYIGSNAYKCLSMTSPKKKGIQDHIWYNDVLQHFCDMTGNVINPYDAEDTLGCDPVRYFTEFQSPHHIANNNQTAYVNNSIMKNILGQERYYTDIQGFKK